MTPKLKRRIRGRQSGVALITILLVVAIATVLGVAMTKQQHFAIKRARTSFDQTIVRQYAYGGEELARQILHLDFVDAPSVDDKLEAWAKTDQTFEFEDGEVSFQIEDLQGRFNLNSILQEGDPGNLARQRLQRLIIEQGLDSTYADRIIDWVDKNDAVGQLGAEDFDYLGLDIPYRTADQAMGDVSELRLILELDKEQYAVIAPFFTALPDPTTEINVNTMSPELMQAVAPTLVLASAEAIVAARDQNQAYAKVSDWVGEPALGGAAKNIKTAGLSVQSRFFQVRVKARYHDRFGYLTSIIQRDISDGKMRVVYRNQSKVILLEAENGDKND